MFNLIKSRKSEGVKGEDLQRKKIVKAKENKTEAVKKPRVSSVKKGNVNKSEEKNTEKKTEKDNSFASQVLLSPRVTEKASVLKERTAVVYVFEIAHFANKQMVKRAIYEKYGFRAGKVNIIGARAKAVIVRGRKGERTGVKKAMVFLKEGEKIEA